MPSRAPGADAASPSLRWTRVRAALACRRCALGWIVYVAVAALLVAAFR